MLWLLLNNTGSKEVKGASKPWWLTPVIPTLWRLRQENRRENLRLDWEFKTRLGVLRQSKAGPERTFDPSSGEGRVTGQSLVYTAGSKPDRPAEPHSVSQTNE